MIIVEGQGRFLDQTVAADFIEARPLALGRGDEGSGNRDVVAPTPDQTLGGDGPGIRDRGFGGGTGGQEGNEAKTEEKGI